MILFDVKEKLCDDKTVMLSNIHADLSGKKLKPNKKL